MGAIEILAELQKSGIQVRAEADQGGFQVLRMKPVPSPALLAKVKANKTQVLAALGAGLKSVVPAGEACPYCKKPLDGRKCWKCHIAVCACGKDTGSAFISVCRPCEVAAARAAGVML